MLLQGCKVAVGGVDEEDILAMCWPCEIDGAAIALSRKGKQGQPNE